MSVRVSSLKSKKSPKKTVRKTTPIFKERKKEKEGTEENEEKERNEEKRLIYSKIDFLLLSLSISNLIFGGETSSEEDLGFLDDLEEEVIEKEEEKEEVIEKEEEIEEVIEKIIDGEDMEEVA
jgi:hypothetical protein